MVCALKKENIPIVLALIKPKVSKVNKILENSKECELQILVKHRLLVLCTQLLNFLH